MIIFPILTVLALLAQGFIGYCLICWLDTDRFLHRRERLVASLPLGLVGSGFCLVVFLVMFRSWTIGIGLFFGLALILLSFMRRTVNRGVSSLGSLDTSEFFAGLSSGGIVLFLVSFVLYLTLSVTVLVRDSTGALAATSQGAFRDVAYHLDIIGRLRVDPFVLEHPVASGVRLNYPFMVDLLSAFYQNLGAPILVAWNVPIVLLAGSMFLLVLYLGDRVVGEWFALALVLIVFFGSGLSFIWYLRDLGLAWAQSGFPEVTESVLQYPGDYGPYWQNPFSPDKKTLENLFWMAPFYAFFVVQRAFVGGFALFLVLVIGVEAYRNQSGGWRWFLLWGLLPLTHTHTFIAASCLLPIWFLRRPFNVKYWIKAGVLGSTVFIPQFIYLLPQDVQGGSVGSFIRPWFGWMYCSHSYSWFFCDLSQNQMGSGLVGFLVKNFGFVFVAWCVGLLVFRFGYGKLPGLDLYVAGSSILFAVPLTVRLQPWIFDNNKLFFYWWLLAAVLVLLVIRELPINETMKYLLLVVFVGGSVFSGLIETGYRMKDHFSGSSRPFYTERDQRFAQWIRSNTEPDASFVANDQPGQFIPMLTGRSLYRGFGSWLWSQGKNSIRRRRKRALQQFFRYGKTHRLCSDGVDYVLWSNRLLESLKLINRDKVFENLEPVYRPEGFSSSTNSGLYRLRCSQ